MANVEPIYEIDADQRSRYIDGVRAIVKGLFEYPWWSRVAWLEIKQSYHGSVLGPFWVTLTTAMMSGGLGLAYSKIFGVPVSDYLPYVAAGLVVWGTMSAMINEGAQVFLRASYILKQVNLPLPSFVYKSVLKNFIMFLFRFLVLVGIALLFKIPPTWTMLYSIPGILLLFFSAVWVMLFLGVISARFRDIAQLSNAMLTFVFFLTPIFWRADRLGEYAYLMEFNPFHHFLAIVRDPLLNEIPSFTNYAVCIAISIVMCIVSIGLFTKSMRRIPYWI